jgi:hypothetical protein
VLWRGIRGLSYTSVARLRSARSLVRIQPGAYSRWCSVSGAVVSSSKSIQQQVREIQKLISDTEETLAQAKWALETLVFRLDQEDEGESAPPGG